MAKKRCDPVFAEMPKALDVPMTPKLWQELGFNLIKKGQYGGWNQHRDAYKHPLYHGVTFAVAEGPHYLRTVVGTMINHVGNAATMQLQNEIKRTLGIRS